MKSLSVLLRVGLVTALLLLDGQTPRVAHGQAPTVLTFAQAQIPVVPRHHHHIYFTFNIDGCDPTQGYYILFQVNATGTDCPETLCVAPWLNCGSGGVATGRAGATSGTIVIRQSGGWTSYEFTFEVNGAFTQIFDATRKQKAASGSSRLLCSVYYERSQPIARDGNFSVLGPIAHAFEYPGVQIRGFRFNVQALGSGQSHLFPGRAANWGLSNAFLQNGAFGTGDFRLTPR
jgi:hypothetical protein